MPGISNILLSGMYVLEVDIVVPTLSFVFCTRFKLRISENLTDDDDSSPLPFIVLFGDCSRLDVDLLLSISPLLLLILLLLFIIVLVEVVFDELILKEKI